MCSCSKTDMFVINSYMNKQVNELRVHGKTGELTYSI